MTGSGYAVYLVCKDAKAAKPPVETPKNHMSYERDPLHDSDWQIHRVRDSHGMTLKAVIEAVSDASVCMHTHNHCQTMALTNTTSSEILFFVNYNTQV